MFLDEGTKLYQSCQEHIVTSEVPSIVIMMKSFLPHTNTRGAELKGNMSWNKMILLISI